MRSHMTKVLAIDSWPAFFELIKVPCPSQSYMNQWLIDSVHRSEKKGYHKKGMDFNRVQRSGISAILRKGESVSASATMRRVRLEEVWRWRGGHSLFLDASCLTYGFDGRFLTVVDYSNQHSVSGLAQSGDGVYGRSGKRAITHSGDVIDDDRSEGKHTINVELSSLSDKVGSLYITLSAWTAALTDILRPEVRCFDPDDKSGEPLARYELDGKSTGSHTAVLMARIWRATPGQRWKVTAIGEVGMGRASDYEPIKQMIDQWQQANLASLHVDLPDDGGDSF
jgi:stress response protein SCP2